MLGERLLQKHLSHTPAILKEVRDVLAKHQDVLDKMVVPNIYESHKKYICDSTDEFIRIIDEQIANYELIQKKAILHIIEAKKSKGCK